MLYSRTLLFIHSLYNSLHLLIPNSQSIPPSLPLPPWQPKVCSLFPFSLNWLGGCATQQAGEAPVPALLAVYVVTPNREKINSCLPLSLLIRITSALHIGDHTQCVSEPALTQAGLQPAASALPGGVGPGVIPAACCYLSWYDLIVSGAVGLFRIKRGLCLSAFSLQSIMGSSALKHALPGIRMRPALGSPNLLPRCPDPSCLPLWGEGLSFVLVGQVDQPAGLNCIV